ncbi:MAG: transglycosylase domain-containing protein [Bacteroidales bacterium]|nr:transglycosylase domain-containing protein [Bacteroidales bacterium]MBN2819747.1 transglycosylase domain-containing protein [Bacteroidales bacterium]
MKPPTTKLSKKQKKLILKILLYGLISGIALFFIFILFIRIGAFGKLPTEAELKQIKNNTATEIITVDNKLLGRFYYQNRTNALLDEIPSELIDALIATEDVRFFSHNGVDTRSTFRVLIKSILLFNKSAGGGSTLTQQLAKNLFPRKSFGILTIPVVKTKEIIIAKRIEKMYSKHEILELYLNTVPFGENTYGIETASIVFFNKKPKELQIQETAMLVGILKANSHYNPHNNPEAALKRRNVVISQMVKYKYLTKIEADSLKSLPLELNFRKLTSIEGPAPYFREHLRHEAKKILEKYSKPDGTPYNLYADGLKIYTTLNYTMQNYAEEAVQVHMSKLQETFNKHWKGKEPWKKDPSLAKQQIKQSRIYKNLINSGLTDEQAIEKMKEKHSTTVFSWEGDRDTTMSSFDSVLYHFQTLQTGVLIMNGFNGDVLAWIGGSGFKYFQYDHVKAKRQVGSTFKPLVYASAIENGKDPCKFYANDSVVYENYDNWTPENSGEGYGGYYSMKGALAHSINTVSVKVLLETGIDSTIRLAKKMGIKSNLPEVPSLALGTGEVSLYEMVSAYSCFINKGRKVEPRLIRRIEDSEGHVIYANKTHTPGDSVMSVETARTILAMMQGTVDRGTASSLRSVYGFNSEFAGKTGTTQNQTDGWFIGMNPNLVVGVWVGGDNPAVRFRTSTYGQGAYAALPIFANFFQKLYKHPVYKYLSNASFQIPEHTYRQLDCVDFREEEMDIFEEFFKIREDDIGDFIKRIFSRKKKKKNQDENQD